MVKRACACVLCWLIDADGTIGIKRSTYRMRVVKDSTQPNFSERIHIRQVERAGIEILAATFGGNIRVEDPSAKRGRSLFRWGLTDLKASHALREMLPFLRIKRTQAVNCLALRALKETSKRRRTAIGRGHVGSSCRPAEISDEMEKCYLYAKWLNRVGAEAHSDGAQSENAKTLNPAPQSKKVSKPTPLFPDETVAESNPSR